MAQDVALQLRSESTAGMAVDVCLPRRWRKALWNDLTSGERCKTPHSEVFTPHSRIPLLISLTRGIVGVPHMILQPHLSISS